MEQRRVFVGDLQGCAEEFEALLREVEFRPGKDRLLPVGDLVNRGPDSLRCLRLCRELDAEPVLGNHDLHLLGCAAGRRKPSRGDTLQQVLDAPDRDALLEWLAAQPLLRVHPDLYQVHAGLSPAWRDPARNLLDPTPDPESPATAFATRVRLCSAGGEQPRKSLDPERAAAEGFAPWDTFYEPARHGGRRVVFGHWAQRGLVDSAAAVGLDTGCVWGGALTAWLPEEQAFVSVPARRVHCTPG